MYLAVFGATRALTARTPAGGELYMKTHERSWRTALSHSPRRPAAALRRLRYGLALPHLENLLQHVRDCGCLQRGMPISRAEVLCARGSRL